MRQQDNAASQTNLVRATAWAGVGLAAIALGGLVIVPSLRVIWVVILVLAVAAVPQSLAAARRDRRAMEKR